MARVILKLSVLLLIHAPEGLQTSQLYPYGTRFGDTASVKKDDACDAEYTQKLSLFGNQYNKLYVCTNGAISLDKKYMKYTPKSFPLKTADRAPLICPFWADTNIKKGGNVFSRITRNTALLQRASLEDKTKFFSMLPGGVFIVQDGYRTGSDAQFLAKWMLIATWDKVKPFLRGGKNTDKVNTFQAVIVSDDQKAYVFFLYDKIEWLAGGASNGVAAQVGFDSGDGTHFYADPNSRTNKIKDIVKDSTVGIDGRMLFKLSESIVDDQGHQKQERVTGIVLPDKPTLPTTSYKVTATSANSTITTTTSTTTTPTTTTYTTPTTTTTTTTSTTTTPTTTTSTTTTPTTTTTTTPTTTSSTTTTTTTSTTTTPTTSTSTTTTLISTTPTSITSTTATLTTTTPTNTRMISSGVITPIWVELSEQGYERRDKGATVAVVTCVTISLIILASAVALMFLIKKHIKAKEERKRRMNEIRKFSYLPTESTI